MQTKRKSSTPPAACCADLSACLDPRLFRALCDPSRIAILARLAAICGPATVSEVASCCSVDLSGVSRHLGILRDAGILDVEKRGREVHYRVRFPELTRTLRALADALEACCPAPKSTKEKGREPKR
jgi:ArsR family transcriptional regulator, arsenate/arsenite/antimonite-responsive transcriptional repressor